MTAPRWATALLRRVAPPSRVEDAVGDLEEAHCNRVHRRGWVIGNLVTVIETLDMSLALFRERVHQRGLEEPFEHRRKTWVSWLDFKLGFRMLVRYPGLTVVGGLAMAFAIMTGAATFEFLIQLTHPTIPLDEGNRIVAFRVWDTEANRPEYRTLHEFERWRADLTAVDDLGAYYSLERNLNAGEGRGEPVVVAEISASAFRVARVPPLHGRALIESDETPGAPRVLVLGYRVWQTRFGGDPEVIGRTVNLGSGRTTIVGIMPEGFAFPVAHGLWAPLRLNVLDYARREGPAIQMFARLAPGVSLEEAQAELNTLGMRAASDFPDTHEYLRPEVIRYAQSIIPLSGWGSVLALSINLFLVMLLVLVCGNVALLMFARAATRERELVVRNALGASRSRIITQLFAEALVLGGVAAVVGISFANLGLRWGLGIAEEQFFGAGMMPFWFSDRLAPTTVLYAVVLTLLGAGISGVMPALKMTTGGMDQRLRQAAVGSGLKFGKLLTGVIITQVAVTVVFPAAAMQLGREFEAFRTLEVGFPSEEYLSVRLQMDRRPVPSDQVEISRAQHLGRFTEKYEDLKQRLLAEPRVSGVTFADRLPRMYHPHRRVEVDRDGPAAPDSGLGYRVSSVNVDVDYFDVLEAPVLSGRDFHSGDLEANRNVIIVNQAFADRVFEGSNPIGRRIRYLFIEELRGVFQPDPKNDPWYEIVGVVRNMGTATDDDTESAGFYHPVRPDHQYPPRPFLAVHVTGDPASFAPRFREVAAGIDPALRLDEIMPLDQVHGDELRFYWFWFAVIAMVSGVALILSLAGIYAVMSFTVSRRTREIGIRVALGSTPRRVAAGILARPLAQVAFGIAAGAIFIIALVFTARGHLSFRETMIIVMYATFMMGVCMLACIVPTRRALSVEPTEALKADV